MGSVFAKRPTGRAVRAAAALALACGCVVLPLHALNLIGVQSRKVHAAGAGERDIPIDISKTFADAVSVEPRVPGSGHQLVFQFDSPITAAGSLVAIDHLVSSLAGTIVPSGNNVLVNLPSVADNTRVLVTLSDVNGTDGYTASAALGFKVGDSDGSGTTNTADVSRAKSRAAQSLLGSTDPLMPALDANTSGVVTAADISAVKARAMPVQLAAGNASNAAPTVSISAVPSTPALQAALISGSATDDGLPFGALFTTWTTLSGPGVALFGDRTKLTTPAVFPVAGTYTLRLTANDGQRATTADTNVTVTAPPQLQVNPPMFQFTPVTVGQSSTAANFLLINTGGTVAFNLIISSSNFAEFPLSYASCLSGGTIAPSSYCTFAVAFTPTSTGAKSATISILTSPGGTTSLVVQGTGQ